MLGGPRGAAGTKGTAGGGEGSAWATHGGCWWEMPLRAGVSQAGGFVEVCRALHGLAAGAQDGLLFCRFMH